MADLLTLSSRIIDSGVPEDPQNRVTQELSEVADGIAVVESFSHSIVVRTAGGLVAFDASGVATGGAVVEAIRGWSNEAFSHVIYTHGHADHVGGSGAFAADAASRGADRPLFLGHANIPIRFARYELTNDWNLLINRRQFGWIPVDRGLGIGGGDRFLPDDVVAPDVTYHDELTVDAADTAIRLVHARGETDDHTWAWIPARKVACVGDLFIWNFPNAGNPQKVQRYPEDWAAALRSIIAHEPELLLPAHGLPIEGRERIAHVLDVCARALETLVRDVLAMMNGGAALDEILHTVRVDDAVLQLPYMRPLYDEPDFVVRNVWRRYGGWWDADPANLKPAPRSQLATELAALAGGADRLAARAAELADAGDIRLASHLIEFAVAAGPGDGALHSVRADIYERRRAIEPSLMTKGIFAAAARESRAITDPNAH